MSHAGDPAPVEPDLSTPDPTLVIPRPAMDDLLVQVADDFDDVIAVLVLRGRPERGLALSVSSSNEDEREVIRLLLASLVDDIEGLVAEGQ